MGGGGGAPREKPAPGSAGGQDGVQWEGPGLDGPGTHHELQGAIPQAAAPLGAVGEHSQLHVPILRDEGQ